MPRTTRVSTIGLEGIEQENEQKRLNLKKISQAYKELLRDQENKKKLAKIENELKQQAYEVLPQLEKGFELTLEFEGDLSTFYEDVVLQRVHAAFIKAGELMSNANEEIETSNEDDEIKCSDAYHQDVFFKHLYDLSMEEWNDFINYQGDPYIKKYINVLYMRRWYDVILAEAQKQYQVC